MNNHTKFKRKMAEKIWPGWGRHPTQSQNKMKQETPILPHKIRVCITSEQQLICYASHCPALCLRSLVPAVIPKGLSLAPAE